MPDDKPPKEGVIALEKIEVILPPGDPDGRVARATEGLAKWTRWLVLATLVVAIAGIVQAGYTRNALVVSQNALNASAAQFSASQRPWVMLGTAHAFNERTKNGLVRIVINVQWKNFGHTPATNIHIYWGTAIFTDESVPYAARPGYAIGNMESKKLNATSGDAKTREYADLAPNEDYIIDSAFTDWMTPAQHNYIEFHDFGWVSSMEITYSDTDGKNQYASSICFFNQSTGATGSCGMGNSVQ